MGASNQFQLPPINLYSVFRFLKNNFDRLMYSDSSENDKIRKKETRKIDEAEEEMTFNETKSAVNDLVLEQLLTQLNATCLGNSTACENMTIDEMVKKANLTFDEDELVKLLGRKSGVNFAPMEIVKPEEKSPALLPNVTLRSAGWLACYFTIAGVLLGLYLLLGVPYFLTGMTVQEAEAEEVATRKAAEEAQAAALNASSYMTYGEDDMMMNYFISEGIDFMNFTQTDPDEITNFQTAAEAAERREIYFENIYVDKKTGKITKLDKNNKTQKKATNIIKALEHINKLTNSDEMSNELWRRSGLTAAATEVDMNNNLTNQKKPNGNVRKGGENKGNKGNTCYEQMLCLRPVFGARAISVSRFAVGILDWVPGFGAVAKALNRRLELLTEAVESGRQLTCHQYECQ